MMGKMISNETGNEKVAVVVSLNLCPSNFNNDDNEIVGKCELPVEVGTLLKSEYFEWPW